MAKLLRNIKKLRFPDSSITKVGRNALKIKPTVKSLDDVEWLDSSGNVLSSASLAQDKSVIVWDTASSKYRGKPISDVVTPLVINELSADPDNPAEGSSVIWMSDGTGSGDDGDILVKTTAGGSTKVKTLVDFSAS